MTAILSLKPLFSSLSISFLNIDAAAGEILIIYVLSNKIYEIFYPRRFSRMPKMRKIC